MEMRKRVLFVSYAEAERMMPFFEYAKVHGPYKEARRSAARILGELSHIRNIDYSPLKGAQLFLSEGDYEFYIDTINAVEGG